MVQTPNWDPEQEYRKLTQDLREAERIKNAGQIQQFNERMDRVFRDLPIEEGTSGRDQSER